MEEGENMFYHLWFIALFLLGSLLANASTDITTAKGTDQPVIAQLTPQPGSSVSMDTAIEAQFNIDLDPTSVQKNNVKLRCLSCDDQGVIRGDASYVAGDKRVVFSHLEPLEPGLYEVEIKSLKADKAHKNTKINEIKYRFVVTKELLQSITIQPDTVELKEGGSLSLEAIGHYDTGVEKNITAQVQWSTADSQTVTVDTNATLQALKEGATTITAKQGNVESSTEVIVYWEVNGHRLPPEPDKALNDATLEGIDSNSNGVRDDVERKIYEKYPKKLHRALLMNRAKFYQQTMIQSIDNAKEVVKFSIKAINCQIYLGRLDKDIDSDDWIKNTKYIKDLTFNTKERIRKYLDYNIALSGGTYGSSPRDWNRDACSPEVIKALEDMGL